MYAGQQSFEHYNFDFFILVVCMYAGQQSFEHYNFDLFILLVCLYAGQQSLKISYIYCEIFVSYLKLQF